MLRRNMIDRMMFNIFGTDNRNTSNIETMRWSPFFRRVCKDICKQELERLEKAGARTRTKDRVIKAQCELFKVAPSLLRDYFDRLDDIELLDLYDLNLIQYYKSM